ncbi:MAG: divergent PAP2 family protein [Candidatus Kerfeldbacteria bacterium]|nr:divergent PAP2 family protein [Candidatus Kerfeldbacteria bacterium]
MFPKLLIIPLLAGVGTQVIKFLLQAVRGELRWSTLQEYGGMPSAHTAFVVSLTTVVGLHDGWQSTSFAISTIFSLLIVRDAIGFRQFLGQHGRILNVLIRELPQRQEREVPIQLVERLGHTPLQAIVGGIIGLVVGLLLYQWLPASW